MVDRLFLFVVFACISLGIQAQNKRVITDEQMYIFPEQKRVNMRFHGREANDKLNKDGLLIASGILELATVLTTSKIKPVSQDIQKPPTKVNSKNSSLLFNTDTNSFDSFTPYASLIIEDMVAFTVFVNPLFKHGGLSQLTTPLFSNPNPLLTIGGIGIESFHEKRIAHLLGLNTFVRLHQDYFFGVQSENADVGNESKQIVYANTGVILKRYYNEHQRYQKHKNIRNNASNYYAISIQGFTPQLFSTGDLRIEKRDWSLLTSVHYGLQRTLGKAYLLGLDASVGAYYKNGILSPSLSIGGSFSYIKN